MDKKSLDKLLEERKDRQMEQAVKATQQITERVKYLVDKGILTLDEILDIVRCSIE